jgi:hypothetical protein
MKENNKIVFPSIEKWQAMRQAVNQSTSFLQTDRSKQFQKLVITRLLSENMLVLLLQACGLMLSTLAAHPFPLWLATGTACAFIFMRGWTILPGIWLGTFIPYFLIGHFLLACQCATLFALQTFLLFWIGQHYINPTLLFYNKKSLAQFIILAATITGFASWALMGVCYPNHSDFLFLFLQGWLANLNGILIFSIALIVLDAYFPDMHKFKKINRGIAGLLFSGIIFCGLLMTLSSQFFLMSFFSLVTLPLIVIISFLYGRCGYAAALFLLSSVIIVGIHFNFIPDMSLKKLLYWQVVLLMNALMGLFISSTYQKTNLYGLTV